MLNQDSNEEHNRVNCEKLISVVIPTHNRAELLPRAINSVLRQTYSNIEIIIVSDGSTDNTKEVVKKIAAHDNRVKYIEYYPPRGGNVARNIGINEAKGVFIAFLDDDDEWFPEKLWKQMEIANNQDIGLVYTGANIIYVSENIQYLFHPTANGNLSRKILLDNYIGTTSTVIIKRSVLEEVGLFDEKLQALQDYELWIRICQATNVGVVQEALINYYNYTGKKQISAVTKKYENSFKYINEKHKNLIQSLSDEELKKKQCNEWFLLGNKAMRNGEKKLARKYMMMINKSCFSKKAIAYYILSFFNYKYILKLRSKL